MPPDVHLLRLRAANHNALQPGRLAATNKIVVCPAGAYFIHQCSKTAIQRSCHGFKSSSCTLDAAPPAAFAGRFATKALYLAVPEAITGMKRCERPCCSARFVFRVQPPT